jgi:hypothetical protein
MKAPSPPKPPDPKETAAAQTGTNVSTAIANQQMGAIDQSTPYGDMTYTNTGTYRFEDPNKKGTFYDLPLQKLTTTFSPSQQALFDQQQEFDKKFNTIGLQQTDKIGGILSEPLDMSNDAIDEWVYDRMSPRMNRQFKINEDNLRTRLANKGFKEGDEAFEREITNLRQSENDAWNQMYLQGRGMAQDTLAKERSIPINEIMALLSGGQVQDPNFMNTSSPTIPTTDYAGIVQDDFRNRMALYGQELNSHNAMLGGIAGLAALPFSWAMSDRRVKEDVKKIGKLDDGTKLYKFRYKGSPLMQMGVMAQEIEKTKPEAVAEVDGVKVVNYGKIAEDA